MPNNWVYLPGTLKANGAVSAIPPVLDAGVNELSDTGTSTTVATFTSDEAITDTATVAATGSFTASEAIADPEATVTGVATHTGTADWADSSTNTGTGTFTGSEALSASGTQGAVIGYPVVEYFTDYFDSLVGGRYTLTSDVSVTGGQLVLSPPATTRKRAKTVAEYVFGGLQFCLTDAPDEISDGAGFSLLVDQLGTGLAFQLVRVAGGQRTVKCFSDGGHTDVNVDTFPLWYRIRYIASDASWIFETSDDSETWTSRHTDIVFPDGSQDPWTLVDFGEVEVEGQNNYLGSSVTKTAAIDILSVWDALPLTGEQLVEPAATNSTTAGHTSSEALADTGTVTAVAIFTGTEAVTTSDETDTGTATATASFTADEAFAESGTDTGTGAATASEAIQEPAAEASTSATHTGSDAVADTGTDSVTGTATGTADWADSSTNTGTGIFTTSEALAEASTDTAAATPSGTTDWADASAVIGTTDASGDEALTDTGEVDAVADISGDGNVFAEGEGFGTVAATASFSASQAIADTDVSSSSTTPAGAEALLDEALLAVLVSANSEERLADEGTTTAAMTASGTSSGELNAKGYADSSTILGARSEAVAIAAAGQSNTSAATIGTGETV